MMVPSWIRTVGLDEFIVPLFRVFALSNTEVEYSFIIILFLHRNNTYF